MNKLSIIFSISKYKGLNDIDYIPKNNIEYIDFIDICMKSIQNKFKNIQNIIDDEKRIDISSNLFKITISYNYYKYFEKNLIEYVNNFHYHSAFFKINEITTEQLESLRNKTYNINFCSDLIMFKKAIIQQLSIIENRLKRMYTNINKIDIKILSLNKNNIYSQINVNGIYDEMLFLYLLKYISSQYKFNITKNNIVKSYIKLKSKKRAIIILKE